MIMQRRSGVSVADHSVQAVLSDERLIKSLSELMNGPRCTV